MKLIFSVALLWCSVACASDLSAIKAEPNPAKRSGLAIAHADEALAEAKAAWKQGDAKTMQAKLDEVRDAVDLCLTSLHDTGKPPYKLLKWYKNAELKTRGLGRQLDGFALEASFEERPAIQKVNDRVQTVHDELLLGVLSRKK